MSVSVVVPTRDSMRTLAACLHSIRAQDVPVELIVVDNASTDGTYELARELADTAVRGGPERSAQRNAGVRLATADWILWIDADMVLPPTAVSSALATAKETGADAVAVPEVSVGPGSGRRAGRWSGPVTSTSPPAQPAAAAPAPAARRRRVRPGDGRAGGHRPAAAAAARPARGPRSAPTC